MRRTGAEELLWYNEGDNTRRAVPYRAPTWSWASVTADSGKLNMNFCGDKHKIMKFPELKFHEVACEPSGRDPNGAVSSGHITLRGFVTTARLSYSGKYKLKTELGAKFQLLSIDEDLRSDTLDVECIDIALHENYIASGLILRKKTTAEDSHYERVGLYMSSACGKEMRQRAIDRDYMDLEDVYTTLTIV